ncbi:MAG: cytochrome c biogenesis protein ResB [Planctomycetes bacterium]|nr:cytochrome c biogenesis protein ResB [Planctomycetota bacterium]
MKVAYELDESGGAGMYIDQFQSDVTILDAAGKPVLDERIVVNSPLRYGGFTFYQSGYDEEAGRYTVLQVSRDPGVPLVYAGFGLLAIGLLWKYLIEKPRQAEGNGSAQTPSPVTAGELMDRFQPRAPVPEAQAVAS